MLITRPGTEKRGIGSYCRDCQEGTEVEKRGALGQPWHEYKNALVCLAV